MFTPSARPRQAARSFSLCTDSSATSGGISALRKSPRSSTHRSISRATGCSIYFTGRRGMIHAACAGDQAALASTLRCKSGFPARARRTQFSSQARSPLPDFNLKCRDPADRPSSILCRNSFSSAGREIVRAHGGMREGFSPQACHNGFPRRWPHKSRKAICKATRAAAAAGGAGGIGASLASVGNAPTSRCSSQSRQAAACEG